MKTELPFKFVRSYPFYTWELQSKSLLTETPWDEDGMKLAIKLSGGCAEHSSEVMVNVASSAAQATCQLQLQIHPRR